MRILFAGTPSFAVPCLQALLASTHEVCGVLTQPDRPAGRGRVLQPSAVKQAALAVGKPVYQPLSLKDAEIQAQICTLQPDLMVVVAYGLLFPKAVLGMPRWGCVNLHASLLPRWRGAAPIQRALIAGDAITGVSLMQMEVGLDTGPLLAQCDYQIQGGDTAGCLHEQLAQLGAGLLLEKLPAIESGALVSVPQDHACATHAPKLTKSEARLDWREGAELLARKVRAFNPWPVAYTCLPDGRRLQVWRAEVVDAAEVGKEAEKEEGRVEVAAEVGKEGAMVEVAAEVGKEEAMVEVAGLVGVSRLSVGAVLPVGGAPCKSGGGGARIGGSGGIQVVTGSGVLRLLEVQLAGGRRVGADDFLRGFKGKGQDQAVDAIDRFI